MTRLTNKFHFKDRSTVCMKLVCNGKRKLHLILHDSSDVSPPPWENSKLDCMVKTPTEPLFSFFLVKTRALNFYAQIFLCLEISISRPVGSNCSLVIETYRKFFQLLTFSATKESLVN